MPPPAEEDKFELLKEANKKLEEEVETLKAENKTYEADNKRLGNTSKSTIALRVIRPNWQREMQLLRCAAAGGEAGEGLVQQEQQQQQQE